MGSVGLYKDDKLQEKVRFPVTRAGDKSIVKYIVQNELGEFLKIDKIILENKDIKIEKAPKSLESFQKQEIIFSWSHLKESLKSLRSTIHFEVVIGSIE